MKTASVSISSVKAALGSVPHHRNPGRALIGLVVILVASLPLFTGCGRGSVLVAGPPSAPPYEGPLFVDLGTRPPSGSTGAAGRVVQCTYPEAIAGWVSSAPHQGDVYRSPRTALEHDLALATRGEPTNYHVMRKEDDRVLYVRAVDHVVQQASIVHRGPAVDGRTGWYVESWARCDWAELPPRAAERLGYRIWTDGDGRRVPTTTILSDVGPRHCQWEDMTFLTIDGGQFEGGRTYVANIHADLRKHVSGPYRHDVALPADARLTGYQRDGATLWFSADGLRAYVGSARSVDVWPLVTKQLGCA